MIIIIVGSIIIETININVVSMAVPMLSLLLLV